MGVDWDIDALTWESWCLVKPQVFSCHQIVISDDCSMNVEWNRVEPKASEKNIYNYLFLAQS